MATPAKPPVPFARLNVPDPAMQRVLQDLYDKLQQLQDRIYKLENPSA